MICPSCHAEIGEGKKFCGKCGAILGPAVLASVPDVPTSLRCPKCGSEVSPGEKFCGACGSPVGTQQGQSPTALPKTVAPTSSPAVAPRPRNPEGRIVPAHSPSTLRAVEVGHEIKHFGVILQSLEAMCKPLGNIKHAVISCRQLDCDPLFERA